MKTKPSRYQDNFRTVCSARRAQQYLGVVEVSGEPPEELQLHPVLWRVHEPLHTLKNNRMGEAEKE